MGTAFRLREGTASQFETAKVFGTLQPKSLYLVDGKPHLALTSSTTFAFVDAATVSQMIAGLGTGDGGTNLQLGSSAGKAPTTIGSAGGSLLAAREDHTHPAQTSITGNANSATTAQSAARLATPRTIRLTGAVTGNAQFSGEADCLIHTTLTTGGGGLSVWVGTQDELPTVRDEGTIYYVTES